MEHMGPNCPWGCKTGRSLRIIRWEKLFKLPEKICWCCNIKLRFNFFIFMRYTITSTNNMKYLSILVFAFVFSFHGKTQKIQSCDSIPALNSEILKVLKPYMGQKILRGECWDVLSLA